MSSQSVVFIIVVLTVALYLILLRLRGSELPPHEFSYGAKLQNIQDLPKYLEDFLSLEVLHPNRTRVEVYIGLESEEKIDLLIDYISKEVPEGSDRVLVISALKEAEKTSSPNERALRVVKTLVQYRDLLRDEPKQNHVIIFIHYMLNEPSSLNPAAKTKILELVSKSDTVRQAKLFNSSKCPQDYLAGNVNIYPLFMENTSWEKSVNAKTFSGSKAIFEIRFMGLRGIFRYILTELERKANIAFHHLDGEAL